MSFSPFDPAVMRRVLGRAAPQGAYRSQQDGAAARMEAGADFQTARLNDAYSRMERELRELISHPFVCEDAETLRLIESLLFSIDMEDFANRFNQVARHVEARIEARSDGHADGAGGGARTRQPTPRPAATPARTATASGAPPQPSSNRLGEKEGGDPPPSPVSRLRLNL